VDDYQFRAMALLMAALMLLGLIAALLLRFPWGHL
jgi:hypothetical protein